jgi:hypothetical protein
VTAHEPTRCGCPGPYNTIAREGTCPTCGVEGPAHERALLRALASGRAQVAHEASDYEGSRQGYETGLQEGRRQALEALIERNPRGHEIELEAG